MGVSASDLFFNPSDLPGEHQGESTPPGARPPPPVRFSESRQRRAAMLLLGQINEFRDLMQDDADDYYNTITDARQNGQSFSNNFPILRQNPRPPMETVEIVRNKLHLRGGSVRVGDVGECKRRDLGRGAVYSYDAFDSVEMRFQFDAEIPCTAAVAVKAVDRGATPRKFYYKV